MDNQSISSQPVEPLPSPPTDPPAPTTTENPESHPTYSSPKPSQQNSVDSPNEPTPTLASDSKENSQQKELSIQTPPSPSKPPPENEKPQISGTSADGLPNAAEELHSSMSKLVISSSQGQNSQKNSTKSLQKQEELLSSVLKKKQLPQFERQNLGQKDKAQRKSISQSLIKDQIKPEKESGFSSQESALPVINVYEAEPQTFTFDKAQLIRKSDGTIFPRSSQKRLEEIPKETKREEPKERSQ